MLESARLDVGSDFLCLDPLLLNLVFVNGVDAIDLVSDQDDWDLLGIIACGVDEDLSPLLDVIIGFCI